MPADWAFAIVNVLVFGFAVYIGFLLGDGWGKRIVTAKAYWLCNLGMLVGVVLLVTLVAVPLIQVCAMGPWKWLDNFMDVNRRHRKVAEKGNGEAYRRRRKTGEAGPDLISVDKKGPSTRE